MFSVEWAFFQKDEDTNKLWEFEITNISESYISWFEVRFSQKDVIDFQTHEKK